MMTQNNDNRIISMDEEFTDSCKSILECKSLHRICNSLHFYQNAINDSSLDSLQCNILNDYFRRYSNLMNDYGHLLLIA